MYIPFVSEKVKNEGYNSKTTVKKLIFWTKKLLLNGGLVNTLCGGDSNNLEAWLHQMASIENMSCTIYDVIFYIPSVLC